MAPQTLSNAEVARLVGVHTVTLERWLRLGKVHQPKLLITGGQIFRLWSPEDVERLRHYRVTHRKKLSTGTTHPKLAASKVA